MKRKEQGRYGLGAASLILILLVLCLALLGVLSLISARADLGLSRRHAQLAQAYAQAAAQVQTVLSDLDAQLAQAWQSSETEESYAVACAQIDQADGIPVEWLDGSAAQMRLDAGSERELVVEIERSAWENAAQTRYTVTKHTLVDSKEWKQTEGLILIGM